VPLPHTYVHQQPQQEQQLQVLEQQQEQQQQQQEQQQQRSVLEQHQQHQQLLENRIADLERSLDEERKLKDAAEMEAFSLKARYHNLHKRFLALSSSVTTNSSISASPTHDLSSGGSATTSAMFGSVSQPRISAEVAAGAAEAPTAPLTTDAQASDARTEVARLTAALEAAKEAATAREQAHAEALALAHDVCMIRSCLGGSKGV